MHAYESMPQQLTCVHSLCYIECHYSLSHRLCCLCCGLCFAFLCSLSAYMNFLRKHTCSKCRLTGRAVFRAHLLAQQGRLVDVPHQMASNAVTVEQLADYLKPLLTAAAGGSLDAYRL